MTRILFAAAVALVLGIGPGASAPVPAVGKPTPEDVQKAEKALLEFLNKKNALRGKHEQLKDEAVERTMPGYVFFTLLFRQFPVGIRPPDGFGVSSVLAVDREGKVTLIKDNSELEKFLKASLPDVEKDDQARDAVRAYLRLDQELYQDGFYKFTLVDDTVKVDGQKAKTASGKVMVMQGGNGEIDAKLEFDAAGKLAKAVETAKIKPGPRPICQATKLLDPDPIVRKMAEQDLRCMGRFAREYLMEQRAKASPELREAIDRIWKEIEREE
jgi:hypothetical protein